MLVCSERRSGASRDAVRHRILGLRPRARQTGEKGSDAPKVIFSPKLLGACKWVDSNNNGIEEDGELDCLIGLGTTTFDSTGETLKRTNGKVKATDITKLFQASFSACYESADLDGDGDVDLDDVKLLGDLNDDNVIDLADLTLYLANPANCVNYTNASVFTIADLITYGLDTANWGTTLVNVRFYDPRSTAFTQ